MSVFILLKFSLVSVTKQTRGNDFAVPYDHKYPLCTVVIKCNVRLANRFVLKFCICFYMEVNVV